jgi:hypothetical protein
LIEAAIASRASTSCQLEKGPEGHRMNENHKSRLLAAFQHVDDLLREAERIMGCPASVPFMREYASEATLTERDRMHDHAIRIRNIMQSIVDELQIPLKPAAASACWAARGRLSFALVAVAEIEPHRLRAYGPLT